MSKIAGRIEVGEELTPECEMQESETRVGIFENKRNDGCDETNR